MGHNFKKCELCILLLILGFLQTDMTDSNLVKKVKKMCRLQGGKWGHIRISTMSFSTSGWGNGAGVGAICCG